MDRFAVNVRYTRAQHPTYSTLKYFVISSLTLGRPGFNSRTVHVRFLVDKSVMWQVLLSALRFSPVTTIPSPLHTHSVTYHRRYKNSAHASIVKWHTQKYYSGYKKLLLFGSFLGAFTKPQKAFISFVMCVCPSVRPHATTRRSTLHFIFWAFFEKSVREIQVSLKSEENKIKTYVLLWSERKRPLGRPGRRWVDNIRMDLQEVRCGYVAWIGLAQDRDRWRTLVSAVMNLRVP